MIFTIVAGCSNSEKDNEVSFIATVLENNQSYLLVEPVEGSSELSSADKIMVSIGDETLLKSQNEQTIVDNIEVGSKVEVFYDGRIAESYPAQINTCHQVKILDYNIFTTEDENFLVKTYINKLELKENEEISMYSTIEYIGEKDNITIWSGEPYFHYTIYNGQEYFNEGITEDLLKQTVLNKGEIYTIPFSKSGGFSGDDPKADFWKHYYSEKELKLPKGEYSFTAYTDFALTEEQTEKVTLKIDFEVKVK
ncbi:YobA family protein [Alkaliphilus sp. MSJ-5]|uniref:YobA family protein n=2 Tax=Alkaliphilus flagellatus TaxID=2841507 RepID=A0ABS6G581_9FIRM|nr:DUF3221 domain-containing protein [Alkaliphilus flagellatus]MBU5677648.1 YobA family protein [Alkaliphilus flagellatus]